MIEILESQYKYFKPGQELSIDEGMIKYKGRQSFRQYMPAKSTKYGVKLFSCCDAVTGYCLRLVVYCGRESRFVDGEGFVFNIVNHLLSRYLLSNYICYTDNFYTSIKLALHLSRYKTHLVGTVRVNSKGLPKMQFQPLAKGANIKLANSDGIVVCRWWDKCQVYSLSTITDGNDNVITTRRGVELTKPDMVSDYNSFMGGVDKSDQLCSYFRLGRSSKKWWKTCFFGLLNIVVVNSYVCYCQKNDKVTLRDFKMKLAAIYDGL